MRYTVYTLDVWGNEEDGFEINDMMEDGEVEIPETMNSADAIRLLIDEGFLTEACGEPGACHVVDISDGSFLTVEVCENGKPILELRSDEEE